MTGSFTYKAKDGTEKKITLPSQSDDWQGSDEETVDELNEALPARNQPGDELRFLKAAARCHAIEVHPTGYPAFRPDWSKQGIVPVEVMPALPG